VITKNSNMALTYEHAWADGVPNLRYLNLIGKQLQKDSKVDRHMLYRRGEINEIKFALDDKAKEYINKAEKKHLDVKKDLTISLCVVGDAPVLKNEVFFSKNEIQRSRSLSLSRKWFQEQNIASDAFIQLSYQIAYRKVTGKTVSVYEACSTAAFQHGRTETIRPATVESNDLVETYLSNLNNFDDPTSRAIVREKLLKAMKKHNSVMKKCLSGEGFDRHLFALKYYAEKNNIEIPEIFTDKSYEVLNDFVVSTSTLNTEFIQFGGFGPLPNCYGFGYMVFDDWLGVCISGYEKSTDPKPITDALFDIWRNLQLCIVEKQ